jgi:periplasmic protein CpxP/Spy
MTTSPRESLFNRKTILAFVAGGALSIGAIALAQNAGVGMAGFHQGMMSSGNPAEMSAHVDRMLQHLYVQIDATDAQKAQIDPLVKQAISDLVPLHAQGQSAHAQFIQAFTQNTIDRNSLEAAREAHLQLADQASRRFVELLADVGSVLTPAQRQKLADHLQQMHESHGAMTPAF